jgi:hypothetical protein
MTLGKKGVNVPGWDLMTRDNYPPSDMHHGELR